jgi:hypothetical protein
MNDGIRPGARVRVEIPRSSPCPLHCLDAVPEVLEAVGTVDNIVAWSSSPPRTGGMPRLLAGVLRQRPDRGHVASTGGRVWRRSDLSEVTTTQRISY